MGTSPRRAGPAHTSSLFRPLPPAPAAATRCHLDLSEAARASWPRRTQTLRRGPEPPCGWPLVLRAPPTPRPPSEEPRRGPQQTRSGASTPPSVPQRNVLLAFPCFLESIRGWSENIWGACSDDPSPRLSLEPSQTGGYVSEGDPPLSLRALVVGPRWAPMWRSD